MAAGMGRLDMVQWLASQGAALTLPVVTAVPETKKNTAKPSVCMRVCVCVCVCMCVCVLCCVYVCVFSV